MKVATIGFTKKSARRFFELLRASGVAQAGRERLHRGRRRRGSPGARGQSGAV